MNQKIENWKEEKQSAYLYLTISSLEVDPSRKELFKKLAEAAENQAKIWENKFIEEGEDPPKTFRLSPRVKVVRFLIQTLGPRSILPILAAMKIRGISIYRSNFTHEKPTSEMKPELRHRGSGGGGNLRAAVFGANDGLVSNASLILGVSGAALDNTSVLLAGIAGLLAGAFSMAAGEYISVKSQRELFEYQIGLEEEELKEYPEEEAEELALIYEAKGIEPSQARRVATQLISDPSKALDTLAREELGLNPDELGSPTGAAFFSFISFAVGALIPLSPFLLVHGNLALRLSILVTGVALFLIGVALSLFTGKNAFLSGFRMLAIGALAGVTTYFTGRFLGVDLS